MISPSDIMMKRFSYRARGFDPDEIDSFKARLAEDCDALMSENAKLKETLNRLSIDLAWHQNDSGMSTRVLDMVKGKAEGYQQDLREEVNNLVVLAAEQACHTLRLHRDVAVGIDALMDLLQELMREEWELVGESTTGNEAAPGISRPHEIGSSLELLKRAYHEALISLELAENELFTGVMAEPRQVIDLETLAGNLEAAAHEDTSETEDKGEDTEKVQPDEVDVVTDITGCGAEVESKAQSESKPHPEPDLPPETENSPEDDDAAEPVIKAGAEEERIMLKNEESDIRADKNESTEELMQTPGKLDDMSYHEVPSYWLTLNQAPRRPFWIIGIIAVLIIGIFLYTDPAVKNTVQKFKQSLTHQGVTHKTGDQELREKQGQLLITAAVNGDTEQIKDILKGEVDINARNENGETALMWTARRGDLMNTMVLIQAGANINMGDKNGDNPLLWALSYKKDSVVKVLLAEGADVNVRDLKSGLTPLMYVALDGDIDKVQAMIDAGARVNASTIQGWTALMCAAYGGHPQTVTLLIDKGADPMMVTAQGWRAVDLAKYKKNYKTIATLEELAPDSAVHDKKVKVTKEELEALPAVIRDYEQKL